MGGCFQGRNKGGAVVLLHMFLPFHKICRLYSLETFLRHYPLALAQVGSTSRQIASRDHTSTRILCGGSLYQKIFKKQVSARIWTA